MGVVDYDKLIDAEMWAFIRRTGEAYPESMDGLTFTDLRHHYDEMCNAFAVPYPPGVRTEDRMFGGVPCRVYETGPSDVTVMYFHGGGWVLGGLESHDHICAEICGATGYRVVSVGYRLAPEQRHPAAFDDSIAATTATFARYGGKLLVAGDSAGASLAATVTHRLRASAVTVSGQVLIYGSFSPIVRTDGSYARHADAPMLTRSEVAIYRTYLYDEGYDPRGDPTAAVLADTDFTGLPPTFLISAECDPLADDGPTYAGRIAQAGGQAFCVVAPGMVHGFLRARHMSGRAAAAFAQITDAIAATGRGEFPWDTGR